MNSICGCILSIASILLSVCRQMPSKHSTLPKFSEILSPLRYLTYIWLQRKVARGTPGPSHVTLPQPFLETRRGPSTLRPLSRSRGNSHVSRTPCARDRTRPHGRADAPALASLQLIPAWHPCPLPACARAAAACSATLPCPCSLAAFLPPCTSGLANRTACPAFSGPTSSA